MVHGQGSAELEERLSIPLNQGIENGPPSRGDERLVEVSHGTIIGKP